MATHFGGNCSRWHVRLRRRSAARTLRVHQVAQAYVQKSPLLVHAATIHGSRWMPYDMSYGRLSSDLARSLPYVAAPCGLESNHLDGALQDIATLGGILDSVAEEPETNLTAQEPSPSHVLRWWPQTRIPRPERFRRRIRRASFMAVMPGGTKGKATADAPTGTSDAGITRSGRHPAPPLRLVQSPTVGNGLMINRM